MDAFARWMAPPSLLGREAEFDHITHFLGDRSTPVPALVVRGEAGVGKTALVEAVADEAMRRGQVVFSATGVQSEVDISLAGLTQLLGPVSSRVRELPDALRDELDAVLALGQLLPGGARRVAVAVRRHLLDLARSAPVLLVVDDVHWIDRATADVLGRLARFLRSADVCLVLVERTGVPSYFDTSEVSQLLLGPLSDAAAERLVRSAFPAMDPRAVDRVLAESQGNALALLELPTALCASQRSKAALLPLHLPLTERLQSLYATRILSLPPATRRLVLVAALAGPDMPVPVHDWSERMRVLRPAEEARLLERDRGDDRVRFWHPLVQGTVVELSTASERRQAHSVLAAAHVDSERAAWHRAAATLVPDEDVAASLEAGARRALRRGDTAYAVRNLVRAAELSPEPRNRARRLADAAYAGANGGADLKGAVRLLADADRADPDAGTTLQAAVATAYLMLNGASDIGSAHRVLVAALEGNARTREAPVETVAEAVHLLSEVCLFGGQPALWPAYHAQVDELGEAAETRFPVLGLWRDAVVDPVWRAHAALPALDEALRSLHDEQDPVRIERVAAAGAFVDRVHLARSALMRLVQDARSGTSVGSGILALTLLSVDDFHRGRWRRAGQWATEGVRLANEYELDLLAWPLRSTLALLAAGTGDQDALRDLVDQMRTWATPRQVGAVLGRAHHAAGLGALGQGDSETAFRELSAVSRPGELRPHVGQSLWVALDLVEAAVHAGHRDAAAAHVVAMRHSAIHKLSPRLELAVAGAEAMTADPFDPDLFEQALETAGAGGWPFEVARIRLSYGQLLRRNRAVVAARPHLTSARATFDDLGALPWARRASQELLATGRSRTHETSVGPKDRLTPQEQQVARLASQGLTNQQIADQLLISPRTVGAHLHSAYLKLAVASRGGLRQALSSSIVAPRPPLVPHARP